MSKMSRIILLIIVSTTLWLLNSSDAEAGWHSPNGTLWAIKPKTKICQNGLQILRVLGPDSPLDNPDYDDPGGFSFSAFFTSMPSSDEPQAVDGEWPDNVLMIPLNSATVTMSYHLKPLTWIDDDGTIGDPGEQYTTNVYGEGSIRWNPLPVGTSVMVHITGATGNYSIGSAQRCSV